MGELKKITLKGLLLIAALVIMNFVYEATLWERDLQEYSRVTERVNNSLAADILYLGDCSDAYFGKEKEDEKGISQLLDSLMEDKEVATISEVGFQGEMYHSILNQIPENSNIKTVVVTMNLRSFAAQVMHTYINNSINQRLVMLDNDYPPLLNRFFLIFKKAKHQTGPEIRAMRMRDWKGDKIPLSSFNTLYDWRCAFENGECIAFDETWTDQMEEIGAAHITNYAFQIDIKQNPRIHDFDKIFLLAKKRGWKLYFHLLPENMTKSDQLIGKELTKLIDYNRNLLYQRYNKEGVTVIDNIELLEDADFIEELPNSHFTYKGRKLMAEKIRTEIANSQNKK